MPNVSKGSVSKKKRKKSEIILYNLLWSGDRDVGVYRLNNGFVAIIQLEIWQ